MIKKHHIHLLSGFLTIVALLATVILNISSSTHATTWVLNGGATWDNSNFINKDFWDGNPNNDDIIKALYGSGNEGSVYTRNWSGWNGTQCPLGSMNVLYTGNLLENLSVNTIYVLTGEQAIVPSTRNLNDCSAVVSRHASGTTLYSSVYINMGGMLKSIGKQHMIIDNIRINGTDDGNGLPHNVNRYGFFLSSSSNNTINNSQSYNNSFYGFFLDSYSNNNTINNSQVYNNNNAGIYFQSGYNNSINNSQAYNNNIGIYLNLNSNNNTINNAQVYNNNSHGIYLNSSSNNSINNSQLYNNSSYGIYLFTSSYNNSINNSQVYNNNSHGIYLDSSSSNNAYYGKLNVFGNHTPGIGGNSGNLSTGSAIDSLVQYVGRTTGELIPTGTMSRDLITNPINTSGNYLLSWSGSWSSLRGRKLSYSGTVTDRYSFGSGILTQAQPVVWSGITDLITGGTFDDTKYIGSDMVKVTGELLGLPAMTSGLNFTVTGNSPNGAIGHYSLFGDITTFGYNIAKNTSTGIILTNGNGQKRVVTQLFGSPYFATHFQRDIVVDTTPPSLFFNSSIVTESQNCTLIATGSDSESGLDPLAYSWSTDGSSRGAWTSINTSGPILYDEPSSLILQVRVRDNAGNIYTGSATCTRTNTAPANPTLNNSGPVNEGETITRTASATDTGTTLSYRWYSGSACTTFLGSGTQATTGVTLNDPGTVVRSVKIFDSQGSGTACIANTGTWNNLAPTAQPLSGNAIVGTPIGFTATGTDPAGGGTPFSYQWFTGASCDGSSIATGVTFTGNMSIPGTTIRSYRIFDVQGSGSNCAIATGTWDSVTSIECLPASSWDNQNFVNQDFWNLGPNSGNIICALYGSGLGSTTAYTQYRSGWDGTQCNIHTMSVVHTGNLPATLSGNTIYVLTGEQAIVPSMRNLASCSAVVSRHASGTTFYSSGHISGYGICNIISKQHTIIDNILINGTNDGSGSSHMMNSVGVYFEYASNSAINNSKMYNNNIGISLDSSSNNSINNTQAYNNNRYGISLYYSSNNSINNSQIYNNQYGISFEHASNNNFINNTQAYNNTIGINFEHASNNSINNTQAFNNQNGISLYYTGNNSINNSQMYNNNNYGIALFYSSNNSINNAQAFNNTRGFFLDSSSNYNSINNTQLYNNSYGATLNTSSYNTFNNNQIYNNQFDGIGFDVSSHNNIIHRCSMYNNQKGIYISNNSNDNKYYGENYIFSNATQVHGSLFSGDGTDHLYLSRNNGTIYTTHTLSLDFITNPLNTSGNYLLSWSDIWDSLRGRNLSYSGTVTDKYSYGSGILLQSQPVVWSGTTDLINSGSFDNTKYIGSDVVKVTGELLIPAMTNGLNFTVTGNSSNGLISHYSLFGNITTFGYDIPKGTATVITLTGSNGEKRVVTQLFGTPYFATHFQRDIVVDTTPPLLVFNSSIVTESQNCTLIATGSDSESELDPLAYSWSSDGLTRDAWTSTNTSGPILNHEPTSLIQRVRVRDNAGNITTGSATCTRTNTAPKTPGISVGPANEGHPITRTASAIDTGTSLSYRWYTGASCTTFLSSGSQSTTSVTLNDPGIVVRSVQIFDIQGSGTICITNTGTWNNLAPTAQPLSGNAIVGTPIGFTATGTDPAGGGTPFSYQWFTGASCGGSVITTSATFTGNMSIPGTTVRSYRIFDVQGSGSNCAIATGTWDSVTPMGCLPAGSWDNQNFVNQDFWNLGPNSGNIICALYGSGLGSSTAYTQHRSGWDGTQCNIYTMSVIHTGNLPENLSANTIYVLTGEQAIVPSTRNLNDCSAVVSRHASGTTLYSSGQIIDDGMLRSNNKQYTIIDNISINGTDNGSVGSHTGNSYGIRHTFTNNSTINNIQSYNNQEGITFELSSYLYANNIKSYNNTGNYVGIGITISWGHNILISNGQFYNNNSNGIYILFSNNNAISNIQTYNNNYGGITLHLSSGNIINNISAYNNLSRGIYLQQSPDNILHNISSYNNEVGIYLQIHPINNNKIYGLNKIYNNNGYSNTYMLVTGNPNDALIQSLERSTGEIIDNGTTSWDFITNPINTSGEYLLSWSSDWNNIIGPKNTYKGKTNNYSYGSGITTQIQPVLWSGTTEILTGGTFDETKYIGSDVVKLTGELLGLPAMTSGVNFTVTGNSSNGAIGLYSLFGDITSFGYNIPKNTSTGIILTNGNGQKRVVTQLFGSPYFATHFQTTSYLDTTPPSQVVLISPSLGSGLNTGNISLVRSAAIDMGVGISGYYFEVIGTNYSGFVTTTGTNISLANGTYTRRVYAIDNVGNTGMWSDVWNFTIELCGNGVLDIGEQCDGQPGCSSSCTRENVFCSLDFPASIYSGEIAVITGIVNSGRTIVSGFNFGLPNYVYTIGLPGNYYTGYTYNSGGIYQVTMDVVHPGSGDIVYSCTGNIEVQYCGDDTIQTSYESCDDGANNGNACSPTYGSTCSYCSTSCQPVILTGDYCGDSVVNYGSEQCDLGSENGPNSACSSSCTRENVSCSLDSPASIYSGEIAVITGIVNSGRTIVSGFNFGLPNYSYTIGLPGNYYTGYTYNSGGIYQVTMDVVHPGSGDIVYSCTGNIEVQYCGDDTIQTSYESCDDGANNGNACSPIYGSTCSYCSTSCQPVILTGDYCGDSVVNYGSEQCDLGSENGPNSACSSSCTWNIPSCTLSVHPLTGYAPLTGTFTISNIHTGWMQFDRLTFGDGSTGDVTTGNLVYEHIYIDTGAYTGTLQVSNIFAPHLTGQCNASLTSLCLAVNRTPAPSTICSPTTFTQTSNCGTTRQQIGTKQCGGGGTIFSSDNCRTPSSTLACANSEGIDHSPSYYDNTCCAASSGHGSAPTLCDVRDSRYSDEITDAFSWAYSINITDKCPISRARLDDTITRIETAKMISLFATEIIGLTPLTNKPGCTGYTDIGGLSSNLQNFAITSCQLNIMGLHPDGTTPKSVFEPHDLVDRAQFGTILSRLVYGDTYNISSGEKNIYKRYQKHLKALKQDNIVSNINNPFIKEKRSRVLLMLKRAEDEGLVERFRLFAPAHNGAVALFDNVW